VNPFTRATVRDSSPAEVDQLHQLCQQLSGFNDQIHLEWVDGFLTSLAAGPHLPDLEVWLRALCGDAFDRAFADPADRQRAQRAFHTRLKVLCEQLNPEKLLDAGDTLRLSPLMMEWGDTEREQLVKEGKLTVDELAVVMTGAEWALGFIDGTEAFSDHWLGPLDEGADATREALLDQLVLLFLPPEEPERAILLAKHYPESATAAADTPAGFAAAAPTGAAAIVSTETRALVGAAKPSSQAAGPSRDELVTGALFAAQDCRLFWLDHAPRAAPRSVVAEPRRNDPCPCGSGKKYKKCCGF
jgi:uncharacterized protein